MERTEGLHKDNAGLVTAGHLAEFFCRYGELSPSLIRKIAAFILAEPIWEGPLLQVVSGKDIAAEVSDANEERFLRHLWESQRP